MDFNYAMCTSLNSVYEDAKKKVSEIPRAKPLTSSRTVSRMHHTISEALNLCLIWMRYHAAWIYGETPPCDMIMPTNRPLPEGMHLGTPRSGKEQIASVSRVPLVWLR